MTRRTWLILSAVDFVSLVGVGIYWATTPKPGVNRVKPQGFLVTARSWLERNRFLVPDPKAVPDISEVQLAHYRQAELDH